MPIKKGTKRTGKSSKKKFGKKGGKKKPKKSQLERKIENYLQTPGKYRELLTAADHWLNIYRNEMIELLKLHSNYTQECVTYDDFKAALVYLKFPFNKLETHIITTLLDKNKEGFIYFNEIFHSLNSLRLESDSESEVLPLFIISSDRGWILGHFHCLTCMTLDQHPFHFTALFPVNTYTEGVIEIIRRHTGLCAPTIQVYLEETATNSSALSAQLMLTDQGLTGGTESFPVDTHFYYRTSGFSPSDWSPTPLTDFLRNAHDPLLWSQMILDEMRYDERVQRRLAAMSLQDTNSLQHTSEVQTT